MGLLQQIGPKAYLNGLGVATLSLLPLNDRAALVTNIYVTNMSAADNWTVTVAGRELMRFRMLTTDNQRLLLTPQSAGGRRPNFFDYCRRALGLDPSIPVPNGMTLTVASAGGATADIQIEFEEHSSADMVHAGLNHYMGGDFLIPITGFLAASQAAVGVVALDTQVAPAWVPNLFTGAALPVSWHIQLHAIFMEALSNNSFSGAANHVGSTQDLHILKNQTQLLTRVGHGPLNKSAAAAAGSANIVTTPLDSAYPPFETCFENKDNVLDVPLDVRGGETLQVLHDLVGDLTGGELFSRALVIFLARVTAPMGAGGQL